MTVRATIFILLIFPLNALGATTRDCIEWFVESKIPSHSKNCEIKCIELIVDMATFMCRDQCKELCSKKCQDSLFWQKQIKDGRPATWPIETEKSVVWSADDKKRLVSELERMPEDLESAQLLGIFRMQKSVQIINPATQAGLSIVLYDRAFVGMFPLGEVIAHELAHALPKEKFENYRSAMKWSRPTRTSQWTRPGEFINSESKISPEEDFANNITAYLFRPEGLRRQVPKAHSWISKTFSKKFLLKEECKDAQ